MQDFKIYTVGRVIDNEKSRVHAQAVNSAQKWRYMLKKYTGKYPLF